MTEVTLIRFNPQTGESEQLGTHSSDGSWLLVAVHQLPLAAIGLSVRPDHEGACLPKINRMVIALRAGDELPPVIVHPAGEYFSCDDGYHRLHAYTIVGVDTVPAVVWTGPFASVRDAPGKPFTVSELVTFTDGSWSDGSAPPSSY